jgi:predicted RNA polymerase sigma factor
MNARAKDKCIVHFDHFSIKKKETALLFMCCTPKMRAETHAIEIRRSISICYSILRCAVMAGKITLIADEIADASVCFSLPTIPCLPDARQGS